MLHIHDSMPMVGGLGRGLREGALDLSVLRAPLRQGGRLFLNSHSKVVQIWRNECLLQVGDDWCSVQAQSVTGLWVASKCGLLV